MNMKKKCYDKRYTKQVAKSIIIIFVFQLAYVESLDSDTLFENLYAEDTEGKRLNEIPAISELIERYPLKIYIEQALIFKEVIA